MILSTTLQALSFLPLLFSTSSAQQGSQTACNNSPRLCSQPYNNITHLGAHDSPFLRDESTGFSTSGNQYFDTTTQLNAGVRLLSAQVHKRNNTAGMQAWHLCHSSCDLLDAGTLGDWLKEVKTWMDGNPNDVVTILLVNSDDASPSDLASHFETSGITDYAYAPPSSSVIPQQWPTLQDLISNNTRLVTFVANIPTPDPQYPYLLDEFTFIFENDFENEDPTEYSCAPDRPTQLSTPQAAADSGRMFLMNHFLYSVQLFGIQSPNASYVNVTNAQTGLGSLGEQLDECTQVYGGQAPTFVLVDFFNVGPAIASVDRANGIAGQAVGRQSVTDRPVDESTSGAADGVVARKGSAMAVVVAVVVALGFGL